jgi:hypothetical protein
MSTPTTSRLIFFSDLLPSRSSLSFFYLLYVVLSLLMAGEDRPDETQRWPVGARPGGSGRDGRRELARARPARSSSARGGRTGAQAGAAGGSACAGRARAGGGAGASDAKAQRGVGPAARRGARGLVVCSGWSSGRAAR